MAFKETSLSELSFNPFSLIGKGWFLVSAGSSDKFNTMTASWGGMGVMWSEEVFTTVVRPCRFTYEFVESAEYFTVCFFDEQYRRALEICGSRSGRSCDKVKESGLTAVFEDGQPIFEQARLVFICKKLYAQPMDEKFVTDESVKKWYTGEPYHKAFTGKILKVLTNISE